MTRFERPYVACYNKKSSHLRGVHLFASLGTSVCFNSAIDYFTLPTSTMKSFFYKASNFESRMTRRGQEEEVGKQETTVPDGGQITCRNLFNRSAFSGSGLSYDASKITHKPGTFYSTIANLDTPYK
ncbi:hypothetical protein GQX74_005935 [Glossina fuscipes]|nr:hypothetical protein GQX74_005935 [Glossina fuscipes]